MASGVFDQLIPSFWNGSIFELSAPKELLGMMRVIRKGRYVCLFVVSLDANFGGFLTIRSLFFEFRVIFVDGTPRKGVLNEPDNGRNLSVCLSWVMVPSLVGFR